MEWLILDNRYPPENLAILDTMLSVNNPESAKTQLDFGYRQHGGWRPMTGFRMRPNKSLVFPGDPQIKPVAATMLREETIFVYPGDWVAIVQNDGSFEVARMN